MPNYPLIQKVSYHQNKTLSHEELELLNDILEVISIPKEDSECYRLYTSLRAFFSLKE